MNLNNIDNLFEEARLLMPWYLTNRLSPEQKILVEQALAQSPELQGEFVREEKIMQLVHDNVSLLDLSTVDTSQQRLDKLMRRIDREGEMLEADTVLEKRPLSIKQLYNQVTTWLASRWDSVWLTPANAAFAALVALQIGLVGVYFAANDNSPTAFTVVTAEAPSSHSAKSEELLLVEFDPKTEHGQIAQFLKQYHAKIVDGPTPNNTFKLKIDTSSLGMDINATIVKMRADANTPAIIIGEYFNE